MSFAVLAGIVVAVAGAVASGGGSPPGGTPVAPDSIRRLIDLAGLADLETGVTCRQFSSSDPDGHGDDHGHFVSLEGKTALLAEMEGPGVITRLWSANAAGRLRIFLDGEEAPRIDAPFQELFTGKYAPFVEPVATHQGGGWISYFPIPYAKHCKVEVAELEDPAALYYQVQYKTWPAGTPMRTFTRALPPDEQANLEAVLEVWRDPEHKPPPMAMIDKDRGSARAGVRALHNDANPKFPGSHNTQAHFFRLPPGKRTATRKEAWPVAGPATIDYLRIDVDEPDVEKLRGLILEVWFDDENEPSVSVPVADLFNVGFGARAQPGLLIGWGENGGYCRLPMPFSKGCSLALSNLGREEVGAFLEFMVVPGAAAQRGFLHAEYRRSDPIGSELFEFCRAEGAGKYVGVNLTLQGVADLWYLEGNEQLFVDDETSPSILGTGTEDFFNGGWYWDSGPLTQPLFGLGVKEEWTTNRTTPWRHQLSDAVPFGHAFIARLEHGSANQVLDTSYSAVAFWYGDSPHPVRRVAAEKSWLSRRWIRRPKDAAAAVEFDWTPASQMTPTRFEAVSNDFRGCEYRLFQAFPVSRFERGVDKMRPEFALLRANEARAEFRVEAGDRYLVRLQFVADRGAPSVEVSIDDQPVGKVDLNPARTIGDGMAPSNPPPLGPLGLAAGKHSLTLKRTGEGAGNSVRIGLDSVALESASDFVKQWWVAPPVECRAPEDPDQAPDPDAPPLTVDQLPGGEEGFLAAEFDPKAAGWKEVASEANQLDLNALVAPRAPIFAYLETYVFSPDARTATGRLGSDDGVRVWLNGAVVHTNAVHRPMTVDADRFALKLTKGWNTLLVKVRNDDGAFGLTLRIADPDGKLRTATRRE